MRNHMDFRKDIAGGIPGKTELTRSEWTYLGRSSMPNSRLWNNQLKKINALRTKYPPDSPAQQALNIFDPRTGLAAKIADIFNLAVRTRQEGRIEEADRIIKQLENLK